MGNCKLSSFVEKKSIRAETLNNYAAMEVLGVSNKTGIAATNSKKSKDLSKYQLIEEGDFAYNPYRINVGSIGLVPHGIKGLVSPAYVVFMTKSSLLPELLLNFLKSSDGLFQIGKYARGTVRKALRFEDLCKIEMPVPSIAIQQLILKKKESIDTEEQILQQELINQQTLLKKLRQQILQEAIEGKLTNEWRAVNPDMEPASELLKRIQAEKEQLIKDKKIRPQKPLPPIGEEEKPFILPEGWVWCRLGEIVSAYEAGKSFKCIDRQVSNDEWGVLKTSAITSSTFQEKEHKFYKSCMPDDVSKKVMNGDLIFCRASGSKGLAGKCCLVSGISKNLLLSDKTPRLLFPNIMEKEYIFLHNETEQTQTYYSNLNTGKSTSMNNITKDQLFEKPLPLPPLAEQKAIVAKVEKLFAICDQLESQITSNQTHAKQLMQAVLKEAFSQQNTAEPVSANG